ncbi:hypothetical protein B0H14DRAFT_2615538 [Mycena olivaceomarginata]|nr:hypothetical protein B0H14DRAFT_2615538 [Mycena olivaceomarginata]
MPSAFGLDRAAQETHFFPPYASHAIFLSLATPPPPPPHRTRLAPQTQNPGSTPPPASTLPLSATPAMCPTMPGARSALQVVHAAGLAFSLAVVAGMRSHGKRGGNGSHTAKGFCVCRTLSVKRQRRTGKRCRGLQDLQYIS